MRLLMIGCSVLTLVITWSGCQSFGLGQSYPAVVELQPSGTFEIATSPTLRLAQLVAANGAVYFLERSNTDAEIVKTDTTGRFIAAIKVPTDVSQVIVEDSNNIIALGKTRLGQRILDIEPSGVVKRETQLQRKVYRIATSGGRIVGWDEGEIFLQPGESGGLSIASTVALPSHAATLPGGRLAIIGAERPALWILRASGNVSQQVPLVAPEMKSETRTQQGVKHLTIFSVASNHNGEIFCAVSPYRGAEGGIVLEFDSNGVLKNRFRIALPMFPETEGRRDGRMTLSHIAVVNRTLFIGSTSEQRCVYYRLPVQ